jgi:Zn-dependent metalloprotease
MKTKLRNMQWLVLGFFMVSGYCGLAQESLKSIQKLQDENKVTSYLMNKDRNTPYLVKFDGLSTQRTPKAEASQLIRTVLGLNNTITLGKKSEAGLSPTVGVERFQQYYKGVKVEHGNYTVLSKSDMIQAIGLEHYDFNDNFQITPSLSEEAAMQHAINFVGATEYAWDLYSTLKMNETDPQRLAELDAIIESVYPKGELVIVDDYNTAGVDMKLAYKFNVYAAEPLYRADIYIDAQNGKMLLADMDIKHASEINENIAESKKMSTYAMVMEPATGIGDLRYAGRRNFETTKIPGATPAMDEYTLLGTIEVDIEEAGVVSSLPIENETKSYDGVGGAPISAGGAIPSYEITDGSSRPEESSFPSTEVGDNDWTADEHYRDRFEGPTEQYPVTNETNNDDVALDAHWGSEIVLRYWGVRHNRYSWDGQGTRITSFVHYGDAYDNAFYTNATMTYGDGSYQGGTNPNGSFAPLMSLDVAGHEIGHGVCDTTSGLVYARQSGGMNEGFSDIWAAAVENFAVEDIDPTLADRYQPFSIGEQIDERDGGIQPEENSAEMAALRFMDDPNAASDPDCVLGANWKDTTEAGCPAPNLGNDQCGVHSNSGVLNKWFYLLAVGSGLTYELGDGKAAADSEVNDNNAPYSVTALGFADAEKIAFGGEVLLSPNATFAEMREMSIMAAQTLYGQGSPQEASTTSAWFAVCVGNDYVAPEGDVIVFNADNRTQLQERNTDVGCNTSRTYTYSIASVLVSEPTTLTLDVSASTAVEGEDFIVSPTTLEVSGSGIYDFSVQVFDDAIIEEGEMISISYDYNGETFTQDIALIDDDITPAVGSSIQELLPMETFDGNELPEGWQINKLVDPGVNDWQMNGVGAGAGVAYITDGTTETPMYNGNGPGVSQDGSSNTVLMTPLINGLGLRDITVNFDYTVGGEDEAGTPLDYGELVYSFDGSNFFGIEQFVGIGGTVLTGSYDDVIPQVENSQFYVGFRWLNDQLLGTAYSFSIDNITISGSPALVETAANTSQSHTVRTANDIFFLTTENNNIIARIENASADLGCVSVNVTSEGTETVSNTQAGVDRSSKVIEITADGPDAATASYDLTIYMTSDELANFSEVATLQIMKVEGSDIDATTNANTVITGEVFEDLTDTEGYATFKGSFTGFSSFAIVENAVASVDDVTFNDVSIYPTPVNRGQYVTINSPSIAIESAAVYDLRGAKIMDEKFKNLNSVQLNTSALQSGFYFVTLNGDSKKTFKFIVN